jgi:hypothetical protein
MPDAHKNSVAEYVNRLVTDEAYAEDMRTTLNKVVSGTATTDDLRRKMALDPAGLGNLTQVAGNEAEFSTTVTTATTCTLTSPTTVTTATLTTLTAVQEA